MFHITGEENLPVLLGLGIGGGAALLALFLLGFTQLGARSARLTAGRVLSLASATFSARAGALFTLWISVSLAYTSVTLFTQLVGRTTYLFETAMAAVLIFLGHRTMLERPARDTGIDVPRNGYWRVLLRSLALGLAILLAAGAVFLLAAFLVALAGSAGLTGALPRIIAGMTAGLAAIWLSTLFARLSFIYPASVLGGRDWFGQALANAAPAALALSASLWVVALISLALIIPVIIWSESLVLAVASGLTSPPGEMPGDVGTALFWLRLAIEELPLRLLLVAYSLTSIACVSAAYRLTVFATVEEGAQADS